MDSNTPTTPLTVLAVGATGSIGRHVLTVALERGHRVRALVRDPAAASRLPAGVEVVVGDLTSPSGLPAAVDGVDAIVFTHGTHGGKVGGKNAVEVVDYGGVVAVLEALRSTREADAGPVRLALMTAIGVTGRNSSYNRSTGAHDWKRRSERLVRASGHPYTIVRPGWFDYNDDDQHSLHLLQGDRRHAGNSSDGVIARRQIAEVLVGSLTSRAATNTTFELVAERGPAQADLEEVFTALDPDTGLDGVRDAANLPVEEEPESVRSELEAVRGGSGGR